MAALEELKMNYQGRIDRLTSRFGKAFRIDKNGTMYFVNRTCQRCGGQGGSDAWAYTGFTCYECGGSGISPRPNVIKVYTPEYEVKLEARRQAKEEKRREEAKANYDKVFAESLSEWGFNENMESFFFLGNTYQIKDQLKELGAKFDYVLGWHIDHQVEGFETVKIQLTKEDFNCSYDGKICEVFLSSQRIEKAKKEASSEASSEYQGQVGNRFNGLKLTVVFKTTFEGRSYSYWDDGVKYFYSMKDEAGNIFTWTTSSPMGFSTDNGFRSINQGDSIILDGTVKEHKEYKGEKQTVLTRCKVQGAA